MVKAGTKNLKQGGLFDTKKKKKKPTCATNTMSNVTFNVIWPKEMRLTYIQSVYTAHIYLIFLFDFIFFLKKP